MQKYFSIKVRVVLVDPTAYLLLLPPALVVLDVGVLRKRLYIVLALEEQHRHDEAFATDVHLVLAEHMELSPVHYVDGPLYLTLVAAGEIVEGLSTLAGRTVRQLEFDVTYVTTCSGRPPGEEVYHQIVQVSTGRDLDT